MIGMIKLDKLIDIKVLQNIQDSFSKTTGLSVVTVNYEGEPITEYSNFTGFCKKIRSNSKLASRCYRCDAYGGVQSMIGRTPHIYKCHAGLHDFAVPIMIEENYVGAILCGQVMIKDKDDERIGSFGITTDWSKNSELVKEYKKIRVKTYKEVEEAANLIYHISKYMVDSEFLNRLKEELNKKTTELMAEEKKRIELERDLKEAELRSLHYQINPHFMFNSLNTIANIARLENASRIEEFVYDFSDMIKYTLRKERSNVVYLEDEIIHMNNYLKIQKIRFTERLKYKIDIEERFLNLECPFMILQPIVENFIKYVVEQKIEGGSIEVKGYRNDSNFIIDISDDGDGIQEDKIKNILSGVEYSINKDCIGLYNINRRLIYTYGSRHALQISSTNLRGEGTLVRIILPINKGGEYV